MGTLEIRLFGTLRVQRPGRPVRQFPTKRVKDLFSYLLIHRHTLHPREVLADLFWDGAKEHNPRRCLNTALWRLQRVLGDPEPGSHPYLRVDAQRIGFNTASDSRLDVAEFESRGLWAEQIGPATPEQQAALYQQQVDLYQGDLLVDCYEEWCLAERERLQRLHLRALGVLVDYHTGRAAHQQAIDCALRLLAADPLREDVHRKLIGAYLASQQPADARRQYQACLALLERELGVGPAPETEALLRPILRAAGGGSPIGPAQPARMAAPGGAALAAGADPLTAAVARLEAALDGFDQAQAEVRRAAVAVADVAQGLLPAQAQPQAQPQPQPLVGPGPGLAAAARLVSESAGRLNSATVTLAAPSR